MEEATEAMLMMLPLPRASIPGSAARMVRIIDVTFRSQVKSQSASLISRILPWWTKPAQLNSTSGAAPPSAAVTAAASRTSSRAMVIGGTSAFSEASASISISVAVTTAPSRAKASAVARPIPAPAAVMKACLPANLPISFKPPNGG